MRIAVIGASGMLGRHAAAAVLEGGHDLTVVYRRKGSLSILKEVIFEAKRADLDSPDAMKHALTGVDAVINCAGYSPTVPRNWREEVRTATTQMLNFYDACADLPLKKIVYLGAAIALPKHPSGLLGDETLEYKQAPPDKTAYLQVKWAMDMQARTAAAGGLPVTTAIPAMSFGEYDKGATTGRLIVEMANRTLPGYVDGKRNVLYAGDAGRGLLRVCEDGRVGERYLLTGENLTMQELLGKIAAVTGAPMPKAIPIQAARLLSRLQTFRFRHLRGPVPKIGADAIAVMASGQFLDGSKSRNELGFRAETTVDEALLRALSWLRSDGIVKAA